jgi:hypothetical protein
MQLHSELISTHGTAQGILPRFQLQPWELAKLALDKKFEIHFSPGSKYFDGVVLELTQLYDIYNEIISLTKDYKEGVENGKYFKTDERGHTTFDREKELKVKKLTNDFFVKGKIVLVNLANSELIKDSDFDFNSFYFCNDERFEHRKAEYLNKSDGKYKCIIDMMSKAKIDFLTEFNKIRGAIEHDQFTIDPFKLIKTAKGQYVIEPDINNKYLTVKLTEFYEALLEYVEKAVVYFIGVNGELKLHLSLYIATSPDFPNLRYKYVFRLLNMPWGFETVKCKYD